MKLPLFDLALTPRPETRELYFRTDMFTAENGVLHAAKSGAEIAFDTYFNSVSVGKLRRYCDISAVGFEVNFTGAVKSEIYSDTGQLLSEGTSTVSVDLTVVPESAEYLYLRLTALSSGVRIEKITVFAECEGVREINPAIVICTYHREEYVRKNAVMLAEFLRSLNAPGQVIVVDNGRTLADFCDERITLISNINTGGSGGFGKGMEYAAEHEFTHIVLMDDDVEFEPVSFQKLFGFLKIAKDEDISVAGSMLYMDKPTFQFEAGGHFYDDGSQKSFGHFLDLGKTENLSLNEKENDINYGGWWFMCMPSKYAAQGQFPLPFFMKYDDVEYALRNKLRMITLNGVGVWHEKFESKYNSATEYYNTRNYLHLCRLYCKDFTEKKARKFTQKRIMEKRKRQQYKMEQAVRKGYDDYQKGLDWLKNLDAEDNHKEVCKLNYEYVSYDEIEKQCGIRPNDDTFYSPAWIKKLPLALIPKKYVLTDIFYDKPIQYFAADHAIHCDSEHNRGYITKKRYAENK